MSDNPFKKIPKKEISPPESLKNKVLNDIAFKQTLTEICSLFTYGYIKTLSKFANNDKINKHDK